MAASRHEVAACWAPEFLRALNETFDGKLGHRSVSQLSKTIQSAIQNSRVWRLPRMFSLQRKSIGIEAAQAVFPFQT